MTFIKQFLVVICLTVVVPFYLVECKKILLEDISTLTLRHGEWTTSRRSSPVPQLKCLGGTAGCYAFIPQHVQCYNRGSDGYDIQWECKTEMENKYRFGKIDVSCEGYDYADDPYILAGSCGLEYTIDSLSSTKGGSAYYSNNNYNNNPPSAFGGSAIGFICVIMIIFFVYRTCFASDGATTSNTFNSGPDTNFGGSNIPPRPPPYGFRPEYQECGSSGSGSAGANFNSGQQQQQPGFFFGMLAGGLLGYLFGNNRSADYNNYYSRPRHGGWFGGASSTPNYFSAGRDSSPPSWGGGSTTRTTSGFGGTKRR